MHNRSLVMPAYARWLPVPGWSRLSAVALVVLLLSLGALTSPALLDFFSPVEIIVAWLEHAAELAVIAALLLLVFTVLEHALPPARRWRLPLICAALLASSVVLAVALHGYFAGGFAFLPSPLRMLSDSLRWGLPAVFLAAVADVHQRALQTERDALAVLSARAQMQQGEREQQLAVLQAQIEPHFLFNVLGNVRRLYRTRPQAGAEALDTLISYLRMALPQLRSRHALLADEMAVVRAYLELFRLRMATPLEYSIVADDSLQRAEFPPMLLMTLVENAIKHGLEPVGGGRIEIRAAAQGHALVVSVDDNGVGFQQAASAGTGVGLANARRQLTARYGARGRLVLASREPSGASASISIPLAVRPGTGAWKD